MELYLKTLTLIIFNNLKSKFCKKLIIGGTYDKTYFILELYEKSKR